MATDRTQEIRDLRSEGYDVQTIARKLELTLLEVEEVVYGVTEADTDTLLFWAGQHH
jgi:DNA-binding NarL/FixJ family response regulator